MDTTEWVQNALMTIALLPVSMVLVFVFMKITGPYSRKFYWQVVVASYFIMLLICWGVETGILYKLIR